MTEIRNDFRDNSVVIKGGLTPLTPQEEDVYFASDWYKEQIKLKRHKLIKDDVIKNPAWHQNNPDHIQVQRVVTISTTPKPIIIIGGKGSA